MPDSDDLERFTRAAVARFEGEPDPDEYDGADVDDADDEEARPAEPSAAGADFDAWLATLSPGDVRRAIEDPQWRAYALALWQGRADVSFDQPSADADEAAVAAPGDGPRNAGELSDWVAEHSAEIRAEYGYSAAEYLAWIGGLSRSQWASFKAEAGFADSLERPAYGELPRSAQNELMRAEVQSWTAETFRKRL